MNYNSEVGVDASFEPVSISSNVTKTNEYVSKRNNGQMWAKRDNEFFACEESVKDLPAGQYVIKQNESSLFFSKKDVLLDEIIPLTDSVSKEVVDAVADFWNKEEAYKEMGFLWKRGILLWGPPGSGKTTTIQQLAQMIIDDNGLVVYCEDPRICAHGLGLLRRIEPTRPIIVLLEDVDSICQNYGDNELLSLLDGELQIDRCVFIATTNYPEKLDRRMTNRPSRFDMVRKIDMPSKTDRKTFINAKCENISDEELEYIAVETKGFSIAHLKEVLISVKCLGKNLDETIVHLNEMKSNFISSDDYAAEECNKRTIGFSKVTI